MKPGKFIFFFFAAFIYFCGCSDSVDLSGSKSEGRLPGIKPDYSNIVIPANCAPLNFIIKEKGEDYFVIIKAEKGEQIQLHSNSGNIQIPINKWKSLLQQNKDKNIYYEIYVKQQKKWIRFNKIKNFISADDADKYIAYRKFGPLFNQWEKMGIFQRDIENFDVKPILINTLTKNNCMNCHNFWQNKTDKWLLHLRAAPGTAMLLVDKDKINKIDTRSKINKAPGGYPAWHPSGDLVAFSAGKPMQFFHTVGETRDELDRLLDIFIYNIKSNTISTAPSLSSKERVEVWPCWSPDGKYLYFCSAPKINEFQVRTKTGDDSLAIKDIKFDLMRISYDTQNGTWGNLETVISGKEKNYSVTQPRISPDGKFLIFTATGYGSFPAFHADADLYLLDLQSGNIKKLELNTNRAESFHSWSSNNRWIIFSSKREDTQFTRLYLSHIDPYGNSSKAFIIPQEDAAFYETCLEIYNVPEFVKEPVKVTPQQLADAAYFEEETISAKP